MSCAGLSMDLQRLDLLLSHVREDVARLPRATVPLVGALVSVETGLPSRFRGLLMAELARRVPLDLVTPAAEAVMRIREFGRYAQMDFAQQEIEAQYALLHALDQVDSTYQATDFMIQLARRIEAVLAHSETSRLLPKEIRP